MSYSIYKNFYVQKILNIQKLLCSENSGQAWEIISEIFNSFSLSSLFLNSY